MAATKWLLKFPLLTAREITWTASFTRNWARKMWRRTHWHKPYNHMLAASQNIITVKSPNELNQNAEPFKAAKVSWQQSRNQSQQKKWKWEAWLNPATRNVRLQLSIKYLHLFVSFKCFAIRWCIQFDFNPIFHGPCSGSGFRIQIQVQVQAIQYLYALMTCIFKIARRPFWIDFLPNLLFDLNKGKPCHSTEQR